MGGALLSEGSSNDTSYSEGVDNGYKILARGGPESKILRLYVGAWMAEAELRVSFRDGNAPDIVKTIDHSNSGGGYVFEIEYQGTSTYDPLVITYRETANGLLNGEGNISLSVATLADADTENKPPIANAGSDKTVYVGVADESSNYRLWTPTYFLTQCSIIFRSHNLQVWRDLIKHIFLIR